MPNFAIHGDWGKLKIFADDTNLFISSKSVINLNHMANVLVHNLNNWLNDNKLLLSIEKTCFIVFTPCKTTVDYELDGKVENIQIQKVEFCKYLGIIIDANLRSSFGHRMIKFKAIFRGIFAPWLL
jgi:hypothetical protein